LTRSGIEPKSIDGYAHEVATHTEAARWIKTGRADAALGLQTAAHSSGLDFIPLFEERYDLVVPHASQAALEPFLDYLQTAACRARIKAMTGYDTAHSGEEIPM
jgi:putative molybdopterin biosynthesis protein